jgi:hypothetical protein
MSTAARLALLPALAATRLAPASLAEVTALPFALPLIECGFDCLGLLHGICPRREEARQRRAHQDSTAELYRFTPRDSATLQTLRQLVEEGRPSVVYLRQQRNPSLNSSLLSVLLYVMQASADDFAVNSGRGNREVERRLATPKHP